MTFEYISNLSRIIRISAFITIALTLQIYGQALNIKKLEPPNWWAGMKYNNIRLMLYGEDLNGISARFAGSELQVLKIYNADSPSYSFIDITVPETITPGNYELIITKNGNEKKITFPILPRIKDEKQYQGFGADDIIYLITPDRFCNADTSNDNFPELIDRCDVASGQRRHGGDIQGIINHLDYVAGLGVTALWLNPLIENNTRVSYHGYGATDLYNIDRRFGNNSLYGELVKEAHAKGLKIILDHINNHIGSNHPWMFDQPLRDWFNGSTEKPLMTPHEKMSIYDVNGDSIKAQATMDGWFVSEMPDLNQKNEFVAKYLIQNTLWWIESTGLDGIREDTYPYSDQKYLAEWANVVFNEYPSLNIVGEVWIEESTFLAPYQKGSKLNRYLNTQLPSLTDFGLYHAFWRVFDQNESIYFIYETLAKDFIYENPSALMTFVDNHDLKRIMYMVKGDERKFKLSLKILFTTRGIPQLYYGTEIGLMGGPEHGDIRENFPGGFPNDLRNAFAPEGRTEKENGIFEFTKRLIEIRKKSDAIKKGRLIHYQPYNEVYCYMREYGDEKIAIIINNKKDTDRIAISQFPEMKNFTIFEDMESSEIIDLQKDLHLTLNGFEGKIYKLIK